MSRPAYEKRKMLDLACVCATSHCMCFVYHQPFHVLLSADSVKRSDISIVSDKNRDTTLAQHWHQLGKPTLEARKLCSL